MQIDTQTIIKSERIFLRIIDHNDIRDEYINWLNDMEVNKFLETRFQNQTFETVTNYITQILKKDNEYLFGIFNIDEIHLGNIKLGPINTIHNFAEISLFVGKKNVWGKGIGTEAINALCDFSFSVLGLHKITAGCYSNNIGSIKAFDKCGFIEEGRWKKHYFYKTDQYVDRVCLAKFKP